jgi:ribosome biogenesis GTPase / thiamine phosphate phosphatase
MAKSQSRVIPITPKKTSKGPPSRRKLRNMLKAGDWAVCEPPNKDELKIARVYVNYGIESGVELEGKLIRLGNRRHLPTVSGDLVYTDGKTVEGILPRGKVLARYADEGGVRMIASHLAQVGLMVSASTPPLHEGFVDRYLVYCRIVELPLFLILNKMDEVEEGIEERLRPYVKAGVDVYPVSSITSEGMDKVAERLRKGITVLSGLSGVGKSTLINTLLHEDIPTQEVSVTSRKGRHTTTAAEAYELDDTLLIDTPGIKKFGFIGITKKQVSKGFPEMDPFMDFCKYDDCLHTQEEGCAVKQAVEDEKIDSRRYQAYCSLVRTIEDPDEEETPETESP